VEHEAVALAGRARETNGVRLVAERLDGFDAQALKGLAQAIIARPGHAVVLLGSGAAAPIVVARAADVPLDAGAILQQLTTRFGGRGGGRAELAQGGGMTAPADDVIAAALEIVASGRRG
jgi:alanyl-tRNA synthetase